MANRASERRTRGSAAGGLDVSKVPVGLDHGPQLIWYEVVNQDRHDGSLSYPAERSETASKRNPIDPIWCTAPDHPSPAGPVSIEFVEEAPTTTLPGWGRGWSCEPRIPKALHATLDAGLARVEHPGHPTTFMAPGGQVFTIAAQ